ncbi:hypothetical protein ACWD25_20105 [Streptomyces sp. NPDC002920]
MACPRTRSSPLSRTSRPSGRDLDAVTVLLDRDGSERGSLRLVVDVADAFGQLYLLGHERAVRG